MTAQRLEPDGLDALSVQWQYDDEAWQASAGHRPFADVSDERFHALAMHAAWAGAARAWFYTLMDMEAKANRDARVVWLHEPWAAAMFVYYGLLYALIEGYRRERVRFYGALRNDIRAVVDDLEQTRHAVFHVSTPDEPLAYDERLRALMYNGHNQATIERVFLGITRALAEETAARPPDPGAPMQPL